MYAEVVSKSSGLPCIVCDKDHVISVAGVPKKEIIERRVSTLLEETMENRLPIDSSTAKTPLKPVEGVDRVAVCGSLIVVNGDVCGCIILLSGNAGEKPTELQLKLCEVSASLLAKQLED